LSVESDARAASSLPQNPTLARLPLLSVIQVVIVVTPPVMAKSDRERPEPFPVAFNLRMRNL
jgi:hypothetical protein